MRRILSVVVVAMLLAAMGQAIPAARAAGTGVGSFEIDGNTPDSPAGEPTDWDAPASAQSPPITVTPFTDITGNSDDSFGMGSKQESPGGWACNTGSAPNKGDITGGKIGFRTIGGKQFVYVNFTRDGTSGSADLDYEFSQSSVPNASCPALPQRTAGDIVLAFDADNGGKTITVRAFSWTGDASAGTFVPLATGSQGTTWDGATNGDGSNKTGNFGEAVLNLTDTIGEVACGEFKSVYMKSRSSTEINSALQDRTTKKPVATGLCPVSSMSKGVRNNTTNGSGSFTATTDAAPGDIIAYNLTYSNAGPGIAHNVVITDTLAAGQTLVAGSCSPSCSVSGSTLTFPTIASVAAGGTVTVSFRVQITGTYAPGTATAIKNSGTATNSEHETVTSPETTVTVKTPITTANKDARNVTTNGTFANTVNAAPGNTIEYQIVVTNAGPGVATGVVVTDEVKANSTYVANSCTGGTSCSFTSPTVTWQVGTLASGASATLKFRVTLSPTFPAGTTQVKNVAVIDTDQENPKNSDETTVTVTANPVLAGDKAVRNVTTSGTFANSANASPGDTIEYQVVLTNEGNAAASGVVASDVVAANSSYVSNSCTGGTSCSFDPTTKTVTWQVGTLGVGSTATLGFRVTLASSFPPGVTQVKNIAIVDDDQEPPHNTDETTVNTTANPVVTGDKDVRNVTTSGSFANTATASPGDTLEYRIVLTNSGNAAASGTVVTDAVATNSSYVANSCAGGASCSFTSPTVSWQVGSIAANGGTTTLTFRVTLAAVFPAGTTLVKNAAVVDDDQESPKPTDETTTTVTASPNVTGNKDVRNVTTSGSFADTANASPGDTLEYRIVLTNSGNANASGTVVTDAVAANSSYVANSCTGGSSCSFTSPTVSWQVGAIAANGGTATLTFRVTLASAFPAGTSQVKNTAVVDDDQENPKPTDETTTTVTANPNLTGNKDVRNVTASGLFANTATAAPGDTIEYRIVLTNSGNANATGVVVTDAVAANSSYVANSCTGGTSCSFATPTVTWQVGAITANGGTATLTFRVTLASTFPAGANQVKNTAIVDDDQESPKPTDETTVNVTGTPQLQLFKAADRTSVGANGTITYTLTYGNTGNAAANGSVITDTVPAGTTFTGCSGGCAVNGSTVTWDVGTVAVGGGSSVTLTVTVVPNIDSCSICNVATIASPNQNGGAPVSSNQVCVSATPAPDPSTAVASGSAKGLKVYAPLLGIPLVNVDISNAASSKTGVGSAADDDQFLSLNIGLLGLSTVASANVLTTSSSSQVSASLGARQTSTAEVAALNLINGVVTADVVRSVASTTARGDGSSYSAAGTTLTNLKVLGGSLVNPAPGTKIPLDGTAINRALYGKGSYVVVNDQVGSTSGPASGQLSGGKYTADLTVTAVRVYITGGTVGGLLTLGGPPVEITVAKATAHSEHKQTRLCTSSPTKAVSGHAFVASAQVDPLLDTSTVGYVEIPASGGSASKTIPATALPLDGSVVTTTDAAATTTGTNGATSSTSSSTAQVADLCLLKLIDPNCLIKATALKSQANSTASASARSSNATGTQFVNLVVAGIPIDANVAPNTVIRLPLGLGFVIINEQVPDGPETGHTGLTVRSLRVVILSPPLLSPLRVGAEIIVCEAHSDATWR